MVRHLSTSVADVSYSNSFIPAKADTISGSLVRSVDNPSSSLEPFYRDQALIRRDFLLASERDIINCMTETNSPDCLHHNKTNRAYIAQYCEPGTFVNKTYYNSIDGKTHKRPFINTRLHCVDRVRRQDKAFVCALGALVAAVFLMTLAMIVRYRNDRRACRSRGRGLTSRVAERKLRCDRADPDPELNEGGEEYGPYGRSIIAPSDDGSERRGLWDRLCGRGTKVR